MSLYRSLASYYDEIFPLNSKTTEFVCSYLNPQDNCVLDIGCATGQLSLYLATLPITTFITAVEPDEQMVESVRDRIQDRQLKHRMKILKGGMLDLDKLFPGQTFDLILCLGNTLVHLSSLRDISRFIHSAANHLRKGGKLIIQVVNYTRILSQNVAELPFIDKPAASFSRRYSYDAAAHMITFYTQMIEKKTGQVIESQTPLYPLELKDLMPIVQSAGLTADPPFSTFEGESWQPDGAALIMVLHHSN